MNILTVPTLLEIKGPCGVLGAPGGETTGGGHGEEEELTVRKVACGSRHTVCLTGKRVQLILVFGCGLIFFF